MSETAIAVCGKRYNNINFSIVLCKGSVSLCKPLCREVHTLADSFRGLMIKADSGGEGVVGECRFIARSFLRLKRYILADNKASYGFLSQ